MSRSTRPWLAGLGITACLVSVACLPEPVPVRPNGDKLECFVDVRPQGLSGVSSTTLSSRGPEFLIGPDGTELRNYQVSLDCIDGFAFDSIDEAEGDWRLWAAFRIGELADAGDPVFGADNVQWCEVPGTLRCETREPAEICAEIGPQLTNEPLPVCGPPVDPFAVSCDSADCAAIDFGAVAVGLDEASAPRRDVTIANAGEPGSVDLTLNYDGSVFPVDGVDGLADFVVEDNECGSVDADVVLAPGEECVFTVVFQPQAAGDHAASLLLTYSYPDDQGTVQGSASISLDGFGLASGLLLAPSFDICLQDVLGGGCTPGADLVVSNVGAVDETIQCAGFDLVADDARCPGLVPAAGFEVRAPSGAVLPLTLAPGAQETLQLRWCGDAAVEAQATFHVRPADPARPDLTLEAERLVTCP